MVEYIPIEIIPSTVLAENPNVSSELSFALDYLCSPKDLMTNPYWRTEIGDANLKLMRWVVGEFCRTEFDSRFYLYPLPNRQKELREMVQATAKLWSKTLRCLERLHTMGRLQESVAIALYKLANEQPFLFPMLFYYDEQESMGARLARLSLTGQRSGGNPYIKAIQMENQRLLSLEPGDKVFPPGYTQHFVDICFETADQFDQFRKDFYTPMVNARMRLVTVLRSHKPETFGNKPEHRGKTKNIRKR